MTNKELLMHEIEKIPENLLDQVLDFIHFLKTRTRQDRLETAVASESALSKDWLTPEEDEAWRDL